MVWFAAFKPVEVFHKDPFLALYFSLFSSMIFLLFYLFPSAALFMLTNWSFGPPPPLVPGVVEATQGALF